MFYLFYLNKLFFFLFAVSEQRYKTRDRVEASTSRGARWQTRALGLGEDEGVGAQPFRLWRVPVNLRIQEEWTMNHTSPPVCQTLMLSPDTQELFIIMQGWGMSGGTQFSHYCNRPLLLLEALGGHRHDIFGVYHFQWECRELTMGL